MQKNYKRKTYYIKNSAQSKFISRFVIISLIGGIIAVCTFNFLAYKKIDSVLYSMRLPRISPGGLLWNEMVYTNIFVILFIFIVFAITARALYNKVHGPLKKLSNDLNRIEHGDLSQEISLRENDEFKDFAADMNIMVQELNKHITEIATASRRIATDATALDLAVENKEELLANIETSIKSINKAIGSFKV